jgi:hypothetical protein
MPPKTTGTRDLFVSHAWRFHEDWKRLADLLDEAIRNPSPENRPHLENIARMLNYLRDRANAVAAAFWQQQDEGPVQ